MENRLKRWGIVFSLMMALGFASCNDDDDKVVPVPEPVITLDSETGVYLVKVGRQLVINPTVEYDDGAYYSWLIGGKLVGMEKSYTFSSDTCGKVFVTFRVETKSGSAEEEMRVDVAELAPPVISLMIPAGGLKVLANTDYKLTPDVQNQEGATYQWTLNGEPVGTDSYYTFNEPELGHYTVSLVAVNEDGKGEKTIDIEVVEQLPYNVEFDKPTYFAENNDRSVFAGKTIYLQPSLEYFMKPAYEWTVDGGPVDNGGKALFAYSPEAAGEHTVKVKVTETANSGTQSITRNVTRAGSTGIEATVKVVCYGTEESRKRPVTAASSALWNKVYEYCPAPGQFINETKTGGFVGNEMTHEQAIAYAEERLKPGNIWVSLGGFGGYIVVGFDHSIENKGGFNGYDFSVTGNQFKGSSEPGIVWVMQDVNGNGEPDDEWYELKGSETGNEETIQDYAVTYYRPAGPGMKVEWTDMNGKTGSVDYLIEYHSQAFYYPNWIKEDSYTLKGTCLKARNVQDPVSGFWDNQSFDWGYADNFGQDKADGENADAGPLQTYFKISNAIHRDGSPAELKYIDFIKVQTGTNAKSGWLGEQSTEVLSFEDKNISE